MARSLEIRNPEDGGHGPPVQLERPKKPRLPLPFLLVLGFLGGTIFDLPILGVLLALGYWFLKRRNR